VKKKNNAIDALKKKRGIGKIEEEEVKPTHFDITLF